MLAAVSFFHAKPIRQQEHEPAQQTADAGHKSDVDVLRQLGWEQGVEAPRTEF